MLCNMNDTNRPTNNSSQGIPGPFIKPILKIVETMLYHVVGSPVIEPLDEKDVRL